MKLPTACLNYCKLALGLMHTSSEGLLFCRNWTNNSVIIELMLFIYDYRI